MFKGARIAAGSLLYSSLIATVVTVASCPSAYAGTVEFFTSSFLTDANQPFSGKATFTLTSQATSPTTVGTMTLTLTDTTVDPISDAPNIADFAFVIPGLTQGTVTGASGQTISNIVDGATPTLGTYNGASPWVLTNATNSWATQVYPGKTPTFDLYAPATKANKGNTASYSVVGGPSANGTYTEPTPVPPIGSANLLTSGNDGTMFYKSVTFYLSITGLNLTNFNEIQNVAFGLGPDGPNKPDKDDVGVGRLPEPATWAMILVGLFGVGFVLRRSRRLQAV